MRWVVDLVYVVAAAVYLPVAVYQAVVQGKNRRGWGQRLGFVQRFAGDGPRVWLHAVSLGEVNATPKLVDMLRQRRPEVEVVVSTTTDTGFARAVALYGADRVFRFPLDFSFVVDRVLRRVRPALIVLMELEVWYHLVRRATRRGVPVAVVNGRLTAHSARRLRRTGPFGRAMFGDLAWVGAQDEAIARRFAELGVPAERLEITSSLKWDTATVTDEVPGAGELAAALGLDGSRPTWVCGSTGPGEEAMILDAYERIVASWGDASSQSDVRVVDEPLPRGRGSVQAQPLPDGRGSEKVGDGSAPPPRLVVVPRKPERFEEVARLIERRGFSCVRRSEAPDGARGVALSNRTVILGDTMGELRKFYSPAAVVFVGRSLVAMGGSDPMEVAALGKTIVAGPHMENFRLAVDALTRADAMRTVDSVESLAAVVGELLRDAATCTELGRRARTVVLENQGATKRTVERLLPLLDRRSADVGVVRGAPIAEAHSRVRDISGGEDERSVPIGGSASDSPKRAS